MVNEFEDFDLSLYPDYEPGRPPQFNRLAEVGYLDEVEKIWGSRWGGSQGIGKLTRMALLYPTPHEVDELFQRDPRYFLLRRVEIDLPRLQDGIASLGALFEEHGVRIDWMDTPRAVGAYGPMRKLFMGALPIVIKGGAIISRQGQAAFMRGLEVNFQRFFTQIDCPILLSVHGQGICEPGVFVPVSEDVVATYRSCSSNEDGLQQVGSVMYRHGVREMPVAHTTTIIEDFEAGGEFHLDMVFGVADKRIAIVYPGYLDYTFYEWLLYRGFNIIEVPKEEHHRWYPANLVLLEPGVVIVSAGAKETIKKIRNAGVEVIEFDTEGLMAGTNGVRCVTLALERETGPGLD